LLKDFNSYFLNDEMRAYFEDYKLYTLQIEVNQVCHQNCIYCYARESRGEEMKTDFVKSILDDAAEKKYGKLSGWEVIASFIHLGRN